MITVFAYPDAHDLITSGSTQMRRTLVRKCEKSGRELQRLNGQVLSWRARNPWAKGTFRSRRRGTGAHHEDSGSLTPP
jgi:hypothetical protein